MEAISIKSFEPELPIDRIDIAEENARKSEQAVGLGELKASIQHFGLIHPVIVLESGDRYKLIVGQRRLLAFKELGRSTIPAIIINPIDSKSQRIVSFGENIHRRKLPYSDTIAICDQLFREYSGSRIEKIRKIAEDLGISTSTVTQYLSYQLVPKKVRHMVDDGKMNQTVAARITSAFWPNEDKIIAIAAQATRLTSAEMRRVYNIGRANPTVTPEKVVEEAKKPPTVVEITITISSDTAKLLRVEAEKRKMNVEELILNAINTFLGEGA